jgi:serine/threonine protein kinase
MADYRIVDDHAYLADFGLTKRLTEAPSPEGEAQLLGTIDYVAPEQIGGDDVDGRADVYSLGCLVHECLKGRPPFRRARTDPAPAADAAPVAERGEGKGGTDRDADDPGERQAHIDRLSLIRTTAAAMRVAGSRNGVLEPAQAEHPSPCFLLREARMAERRAVERETAAVNEDALTCAGATGARSAPSHTNVSGRQAA